MNLSEYSFLILSGDKLEDKLTPISNLSSYDYTSFTDVKTPLREKKIAFSPNKTKFPKLNQLHLDIPKAKALHFFANHELLAIEIMARALSIHAKNKDDDLKIKKQIIKTISEEQKHFKLYVNKMNELGVEFGDFAINDFFWRQASECKSIDQYFALVALCFEQANLDFAKYYYDFFYKIEDFKTADILNTVLVDEISHVGIGHFWLSKWNKDPLSTYFANLLPGRVTPARAKGISFYREAREQAKLSDDFIDYIRDYKDDFSITNRKQWKK